MAAISGVARVGGIIIFQMEWFVYTMWIEDIECIPTLVNMKTRELVNGSHKIKRQQQLCPPPHLLSEQNSIDIIINEVVTSQSNM